MEVSPEDAVPYLDRVPAGVVELVRKLGGTVVPSAPLVSRFAASWSATETADHLYAAEVLAEVAQAELRWAVRSRARESGRPSCRRGWLTGCTSAGSSSTIRRSSRSGPTRPTRTTNRSREPDAVLEREQVVLLDLWAGRGLATVFADQTWMGFSGRPAAGEGAAGLGDGTGCARRGDRAGAGRGRKRPVAGFEADRAARAVIEKAGFGEYFVHRTGHSIDRDLHGSGPHLDDYETHDDRELVRGSGSRSSRGSICRASSGCGAR